MNPKKKELVNRIRKTLHLSEIDASDKDLLECFVNTTLSDSIDCAVADEELRHVLKKHCHSMPFQP